MTSIQTPFVRAPASNYSTLYSALQFSLKQLENLKQEKLYITFDQPLYLKALDLVLALRETKPEYAKLIPRFVLQQSLILIKRCLHFFE